MKLYLKFQMDLNGNISLFTHVSMHQFYSVVAALLCKMDQSKSSHSTLRRLRTLASHISTSQSEGVSVHPTSNRDEDYTRSKINTATIAQERSKSRFDSKEMAWHIDGGKDKTEVRTTCRVVP